MSDQQAPEELRDPADRTTREILEHQSVLRQELSEIPARVKELEGNIILNEGILAERRRQDRTTQAAADAIIHESTVILPDPSPPMD